jgi:hypothetical protein
MRGGSGSHPLPSPIPVSPINNKHYPIYPRTLTLVWNPVTGATGGYSVTVQWYSNTPQGQTWLAKPPINTTSTSLTVDFPANCPGRWCVKALDRYYPNQNSADSPWSTFDFTPRTLEAPVPVSPANGPSFSNYPRHTTLTWKAVANATAYVVAVDACQDRVATSGSIWQIVVPKTMVQGTSYTFDFVGAQPGRWCVFAIDNTRNYADSSPSVWSYFSFSV